MKTIITYGTFDLFHFGHVRLFKRLKKLGDKLIVGVSTDEFNALKGKAAFFNFQQRQEIVAACKYVDEVIAENDWRQKRNDIIRLNADIFAIGDDWKGKFDDLSDICNVFYLERTQQISTTEIKNNLANRVIPDPISHPVSANIA
ncbi:MULTISPECIES: adenylyltransferase/cytidyltransferase family protein [Shewanella]|jgi:glycerol-3-phosphate cytidylyltransferase|uniref:Glycerol-3-phosphate cytidylyltransferase n=1 Tax=Shewanella psychromarinicola TaxID=2487742 RepID=A0A3N4E0J3_9GAMM|nr:adenylyltransferase/cytidyltransferase family protein [Shewanella psychromarinicola]AZG35695.1 glycerol-3-phosphate cytidylyltransferase [Shewanella psychromarinicola]MCL1081505.1 adenylyltransferase/cytidyltransferase family protein [Shewanella psychromarinicola]RPA30382.1 glycerol-3-phosphate cytidylyltransferase [Shewanella psychromarinicola]